MEAITRFNERYNHYAEKIVQVVLEHKLLIPGEEHDFASYVRGY